MLESKDGVDFYVTDQKAIQHIGHEVIDKFGGHIKITSKLVTKDKNTGKDLFRVTVLVRLSDFSVGDVIAYENKLIRVGKMGKHISGFNLIRNKHTSVTIKDEEDVTKLMKHKTTITTTHPELTIMHPETFQPVKAYNMHSSDYQNGENVTIVFFNNKAYIVPNKTKRK
jgi:nonsense-mediated mRNA decay protein 3